MKRKSIMILFIAFLVLASGTVSFYNRKTKRKGSSGKLLRGMDASFHTGSRCDLRYRRYPVPCSYRGKGISYSGGSGSGLCHCELKGWR